MEEKQKLNSTTKKGILHNLSLLKLKLSSILKFNIASALKNNPVKKITLVLIAILLTTAVISATKITQDINIDVVEDCKTIYWETTQDVFGTCTKYNNVKICDDEPLNTSCHIEEEAFNYRCVTGTEIIQNTKKECTAKEFNVEVNQDGVIKNYNLDFSDWGACIYNEENNCLIVTCVSKYDGAHKGQFNGCEFGKSCQQFRICKDSIKTLYKHNSNEFKEVDNTFILERLEVGVGK